jgi:hypothetical protein
MRFVISLSWVVTLLSTISALFLLVAAFNADAAPAQGAAAAVACGFAIVPYVFTRALEALNLPKARLE